MPETLCGEGGIRTLGTPLARYAGLANRWFQPLTHLSVEQLNLLFGYSATPKIMPSFDPIVYCSSCLVESRSNVSPI